MDKTLTVKQRRIDVYLPTLEAKARWNAEAAKRNQSISQLVFELVELSLVPPEPDADLDRLPALEAEKAKLSQENEALRRRNEELEALNQRASKDLERYKDTEFLAKPVVSFNPRLVRLLTESKTRTGEPRPLNQPELVQSLRIKGEEALKGLAEQLEYLELHGMVRKSSKGWVWIE